MKILFEEYQYLTEEVKDILGSFILNGLDLTKPTQQMRYVGYFFNKDITNHDGSKGDLVFILPKVLLDAEGKAFGLDPKQIINFNFKDWKNDEKVTPEGKLTKLQVYNFIYGFATWIYRAVDIYRKSLRNKPKLEDDDTDVEVMTSVQVGQSGKKENVTFMDILLSLLDFQRTHRNFITFVIKMAHTGFNKVSWPKTIARTQAVVQNGSPIYLNPINKERVVNFDEELLIIYYSILDYMHEEYGFPISNQPGYKLIKGAMFRSYMKSQGKTRLHKIRYKYYSDDAILLWNLCYAFFDVADNIKGQANRKDYLLINKFETVFEGMIDELIGDKDLPAHLKNQADDKRIDHLYTYKYLLENMDDRNDKVMSSDIYNIADSKYYRRDKGLQGHDVPKQFTYVRNVIQWHMDLLHDILKNVTDKAEQYIEIPLFDETTEGYNIIPNFFISSQVDEELNYDNSGFGRSRLGGIEPDANGSIPWVEEKNLNQSFFFWERLFDRNTYFTLHFDVNFLYILKMYAQNKSYNKAAWKQEVRDEFRKGILDYLNNEFFFYQVMTTDIDEFVEKYYRQLQGKFFSFGTTGGNRVLLYAERKSQDDGHGKSYKYNPERDSHIENDYLVIPVRDGRKTYRVVKMKLGADEYVDTDRCLFFAETDYRIEGKKLVCSNTPKEDLGEVKNPDVEYALIGYCKDKSQLDWVEHYGIYNIPAYFTGDKVKKTKTEVNAKYLILYNEKLGIHVYNIKSKLPALRLEEEFEEYAGYKPSRGDAYLVYDIDKEPAKNQKVASLTFKDIGNKVPKDKPFKPCGIRIEAIKQGAVIIEHKFTVYTLTEEDGIRMAAEEIHR